MHKRNIYILRTLILSAVLLLACTSLRAQEKTDEFKPSGRINATVFFDYYYTVHADTGIMNTRSVRNAAVRYQKNSNAFQFRRVYLGYDYRFSPKISSLVRFEADEKGLTSDGKIGVALKDAYLKWNVFNGSDLYIGLQSTISYESSEKIWGHRFLEKTILDLRGIVASRDMGISLRGQLDAKGKYTYALLVANNSNTKPESDRFKRIYANIGFKPTEGLELTVFADQNFKAKNADGLVMDEFTTGASAGFKQEKFAFGIEGFIKQSGNGVMKAGSLETLNTSGVSVFGSVNFTGKFGGVARFDYFDANTDSNVGNDARNLVIAGLTYKPIPALTVSPNVEMETYQKISDRKIDPTVLARLTVSWNIK